MKPRIEPLPDWVLTNVQPAFYDTESVTVLSLLSKIYGKINELISSYNEYTEETDAKIDEAIAYMKTNLTETVSTLFEEALDNGDITASLTTTYDSTTESLTLSIEAN
jgi:hypothetical protein